MSDQEEPLFDTKKKKESAISVLREMSQSEGWALIVRVLSANVEILQRQVNDIEKNISDRDLWRLKVKRRYQEMLIDLPQRLIEDLRKSEEATDVDLDPYD